MIQTIRSFIAIELSEEAQAALADLQNRLKGIVPSQTVRWTAPENIHLTLHFLGNIAAADIEKITEALRLVASVYPPMSLTLGNLGCFPNTRRPRIVWTGVSGQVQQLIQLHRELGDRLKGIGGFTPETRPYSPHLTIGRVKDNLPPKPLAQLGEVIERKQGQVGELATSWVTEISLMQSDLRPSGPVYTQLSSASLKKSA
jgi:2'-5' RNA ligase